VLRGGSATRQATTVAHPVKARVLADTHQITGSFVLRRGDVNRLEQTAGEQTRDAQPADWS
jgi:hypothetical protein